MKPDELRLASLLADAGAIVWNATNDRLVVDEPAARLFGVHRRQFGAGLAGLLRQVVPESRDTLAAALERAVVEGTVFDVEIEVDFPDTTRRTLLLRGAVVDDLKGGTRIVLGVRDATALAAARTERAAAQRALAEQAAAHQKAIAILDGAARDRADLVAGLSREIRTRLGAVLGMSRLLLDGSLAVDQRDQVTTIETAGDELLAFAADVIDIAATAEAGSAEPDLHVVAVHEMLATAVAAHAPLARERGVTMRYAIERGVPGGIRADAGRLTRVLGYVLREAAATAPATTEIAIVARARRLAGTLFELAIEVADRSNEQGEVSLGLSVAARLARRMGGRLVVTRDPTAGTRATLEVSVDETELEQPAAPFDADPLLGMKHPLRILVAEDNAVNRRVIDAFCGRLGYTARHASNGREAVEAIEREPYDLVFMDIHMPEVDGLEATRLVRARPPAHGPGPRIVALTANALPSDRAACLRAGCDDYIAKPVTLEKLAHAILACPPAPQAAPNAAALDDRALARLDVALGRELLAEILTAHESDARELVHGLRGAAERGDANLLVRLARTLAATSATLGAPALDHAATQLAQTCERGELAQARGLVDRLAQELAQVRVALEPRLRSS